MSIRLGDRSCWLIRCGETTLKTMLPSEGALNPGRHVRRATRRALATLCAVLLVAALCAVRGAAPAQAAAAMIDASTLFPAADSVEIDAINNNGLLAAMSSGASSNSLVTYDRATRVVATLPIDVTSIPASITGINDHGLVVGVALKDGGLGGAQGFVYDPTTQATTRFDGVAGDDFTIPVAVNNSGMVVGQSIQLDTTTGTVTATHAWAYDSVSKTSRLLPPLNGDSASVATAINDAGVVVGVSGSYLADEGSGTPTGSARGFTFDLATGTIADLGPGPDGGFVIPSDINNLGQIAGMSTSSAAGILKAFVYDPTSHAMTSIGSLPGDGSSYASSINNNGLVAGTSGADLTPDAISGDVGNTQAFTYDVASKVMVPLGRLVGDNSSSATTVNDQGVVLGRSEKVGSDGTVSVSRSFVYDQVVARANGSLVQAAYADFLGRAPSSTELARDSGVLDTGGSASGLIATLSTSREWVSAIVTGFYADTLGRTPDQTGLTYWTNLIASGRIKVATAAASFYASNEYFSVTGKNDLGTWVDDLYLKILHRSVDTGGRSYWVGMARSRGRNAVAYALYQSDESRMDRVEGLYEKLLHRAPEDAGQRYWANVILTSGDIAVARTLAVSPEYAARAVVRFP